MNYTKEAEVDVDRFSLETKIKRIVLILIILLSIHLQKALYIHSFEVEPFASEQKFANAFHFQKDRYNISLNGNYFEEY